MSSRKSLLSARWLALAFVAGLAHAAVPQGIDAEREEARLTREYPRLFVADAYLTSILGRIVTAAPDSMVSGVRIRALRDNAPYVFCLGNGAIYVSTGLLARLENDSQVAGIIAPEVASAFAPNGKLQAEFNKKNGRYAAGALLAVIATAGIAAFPYTSAESKRLSSQADALIVENDRTAAIWLRRAGFDVSQMPLGPQRLREQLEAEKQFGTGRLAEAESLARRADQMQRALAALPAEETPSARVPDEPQTIRKIAHLLSLQIVLEYLDGARSDSAGPLIDRIEREYGPNAQVYCLRAQYLRKSSTGTAATTPVIDAFRKCVASPDAPAMYFRELGYLYRSAGDTAAAVGAFEEYLKQAPTAVDAPIVRLQIEELRANVQ